MCKATEQLKMAYEKGYRATDNGEVISPSCRTLKLNPGSTGYLKFTHYNYPVRVHRLVAYQKFGEEIFNNDIVVRHVDGNITNNSWDNIDIGTQSDNMFDIPRADRLLHSKRATSFWKKHNYSEIYDMHLLGKTYSQIMEEVGISSKGTLSHIINKERKNRELV